MSRDAGRPKKASGTKKVADSPFAALEGLKKKLADEEEAKKQAKKAPGPPPYVPPKRKAPSKGAAEPGMSEEDLLSFHRLMSGVTPLDAEKKRIPRTQQALEPSKAAELARARAMQKSAEEVEAEAVHEHLRSLVEGRTRFEVTDDGKRVEGRRVDVLPELVRKLRRGLFPIDAQIDLHGLTAGEARPALEAFLREKRTRGERCVLVVHGKGEHSPGGAGVLRGEMAAWLSQGPSSEHVAAFATAHEDDGGHGAVYVLLRR